MHFLKNLSSIFDEEAAPSASLAALTLLQDWTEAAGLQRRSQFAHVSIDVQNEFCDPSNDRGNAKTDIVATRIAHIAPTFRALGVANYWVYFGRNKTAQCHDFYKVKPKPDEILVSKNRDSAFSGGNLDQHLRKDRKKVLLVSGVNYSFCVFDTVMDARKNNYNVVLLSDLAANGRVSPRPTEQQCKQEMEKAGVIIVPSTLVLQALK